MNQDIAEFLRLDSPQGSTEFSVINEECFETFVRKLVHYKGSEDDTIPAYLFVPKTNKSTTGILVHHQHNGERHLGKSEVAGIAGDPLQAFGPKLAELGFTVLAPDSICFEDRRINATGTQVDADNDHLQHFNELTYRIVQGDNLMKKVLDDANIGLTLLRSIPQVSSVGVIGHSYGGNTTLFQAATNDTIKFACASGAVCSYKNKIQKNTSFEFALTIPGFYPRFDFEDLVAAVYPRKFLSVAGLEDKYGLNSREVVESARKAVQHKEAEEILEVRDFEGGHALNQERVDCILYWLSQFL